MGTIGLASYQFSTAPRQFTPKFDFPSGLSLPPAGGVGTTASISKSPGGKLPIEVMRLPDGGQDAPLSDLSQSQIEVLQKEIVGLRRRLSALAEQNVAYSRRIAALEKEAAVSKLPGSDIKNGAGPAEPSPGVVRSEAATATPMASLPVPPVSPKMEVDVIKPAPAISAADGRTIRKDLSPEALPEVSRVPPRMISMVSGTGQTNAPSNDFNPAEPVRIVDLPQVELPPPGDAPEATGSIPLTVEETAPSPLPSPEAFDATPTQTTSRPTVVTPSSPAGRLHGGSDSKLKRSDFGAIIGHYSSTAAAAKAWADFKNQNVERMRDLRPLLMERTAPQGGIALMVGPFANAADAAVACLQLLDVTELCHPALFAGDPLVTAAEFRDTAF
jgi:hypothetical protein